MRQLLLAAILAAPFAAAQPAPPAAASPAAEPKKIHLEGRILSTAGEPIRKANVRLTGSSFQNGQAPTSYAEATDNDGKFLFDDVVPDRYSLSAEKPGFVAARYGARSTNSPGTQLNLSAGQALKDLVMMMTPQGVITGRVTDQDGDPVRAVQIMVLRSAFNQGKRQLVPANSASTDDQGNFRASNLAPGRYYLNATDRSNMFMGGPNDRPGQAGAKPPEASVATYYPSALDAESAAPIDVTAGAELSGINIRLRKARVFSIRGKALDTAAGAVPQNSMLTATRKLDNGNVMSMMLGRSMQQVRQPDGAFEFRGLAPGTYILQNMPMGSTFNGAPVTSLTGRTEVTITDSNIENVVLALGPGVAIDGTVRLEDGDLKTLMASRSSAPSGAVAVASAGAPFLAAGLARPRITLLEAEGMSVNSPGAQIGEDGAFKIQGVYVGKYTVNLAALPEGTYVKSIRFGGQDVSRSSLDLTSGSGGALDILLSLKAADVSGVLRDSKGEAMGGIQVTVWPKDLNRATPSFGVRTASTDQNGSFKLTGLPPGEYYAAAWDDPEPGLTQSPDFLARFTGDAVALKLSESSHETADVKLIPREKIAMEAAKIQ